ncbi:PhoP regulatory network protein YrbL [Pseudooceanicola antarcticus]|nr:YrbL family protein [Pseudooceanicola antarcticus]SNY55714.1 PhoP regulatory network protein YrbL [Pseudooceanicola antarcticus]
MTKFDTGPVTLAGQEPLRSGEESLVYQHPRFQDLLLKLPRQDGRAALRMQRPGFKRPLLRRFRHLVSWHLEYSEYLSAVAREGTLPGFVPLHLGICPTDLGPALLVEKICAPGGELAPTLRDLANTGRLDASIPELLEDFLENLAASGIVTRDIWPDNLVLAEAPRRLMLIEGMGCRSALRACHIQLPLTQNRQIRQCAALRRWVAERVEPQPRLPQGLRLA